MMSAHSGRLSQSPSMNQHNSNGSRNTHKSSKSNRPHKKAPIAQMARDEKKRLWEQLADYSLSLIEQAADAKCRGQKIKYNHSPEINALFEKCGLRAPKNGKGAERLHENFMKKIKLLNPSSKKKESAPKKQRWQPKGDHHKQRHHDRGAHTSSHSFSQQQQFTNQQSRFSLPPNSHNPNNGMFGNQGMQQMQYTNDMRNVNKQRLQSKLPAPQMPQGAHAYSRSMGSAALSTFHVNHNVTSVNSGTVTVSNTMNVSLDPFSTNMNAFNSTASNMAIKTQNAASSMTTTLTIPSSIQATLNVHQLWQLYQQAQQDQQAQIQAQRAQQQMVQAQQQQAQIQQQHLRQLQQQQQQGQIIALQQLQQQQQQQLQQQQQQSYYQQHPQSRQQQQFQTSVHSVPGHQPSPSLWAIYNTNGGMNTMSNQMDKRTSLPTTMPSQQIQQWASSQQNPTLSPSSSSASLTPYLTGLQSTSTMSHQSTNSGQSVPIIPHLLPHHPSPYHQQSVSTTAIPIMGMGALIPNGVSAHNSALSTSMGVSPQPMMILMSAGNSCSIPMMVSPPNPNMEQLNVTALGPAEAASSEVMAITPTSSGSHMKPIAEHQSTPKQETIWYSDVAPASEQRMATTPVNVVAPLSHFNYPNYPPEIQREMRESNSNWTQSASAMSFSKLPIVGVKNAGAEGERPHELFRFLEQTLQDTVLLLDLDQMSSRSVSLSSAALNVTGCGTGALVNRLSSTMTAPNGMLLGNAAQRGSYASMTQSITHFNPNHSMQYSMQSAISDFSVSDIRNPDDVELPEELTMGKIPESKSQHQFQLNVDIGANKLMPPLLDDPNSKSSSSDKKSRASSGQSGISRLSQIANAPLSRNSAVSGSGGAPSTRPSGRASALSPLSSSKRRSMGIMALVPHNDLHALLIFEPIIPFETLELFRERTSDQSLKDREGKFKAILAEGFESCIRFLRHRIQRSLKDIALIYFVSFALPIPTNGVCETWHQWSAYRTNMLSKAMEECKKVCRESKMKTEFMCCATPIPPATVNEKKSTQSKAQPERKDLEEDYVLSEESYEKSNLPFKLREDIVRQIQRKVTSMKRANSVSFGRKTSGLLPLQQDVVEQRGTK